MNKKMGFIGLGTMGGPMATRLLNAGQNLIVFDIRKEAMAKLEQKGAKSAASPKVVAEKSEVVFTMLLDSPDVEAVILDKEGVLAGAKPGSVVIDISTDRPSTSRMLAKEAKKKKVCFLGAGVDGTPAMVASGTVRIYVGGERRIFDKYKGILEIFTPKDDVIYMGDIGTGEAIKIVNQMMSALNILSIAEGLSLGVKLGIPPQVLFDVLSKAGASSRMLEYRVKEPMLKGKYEPASFRLDLMIKDIRLALEEGKDLRVPLPVLSVGQQLYIMASAAGKGNKDLSAIANFYEELAGVKFSAK